MSRRSVPSTEVDCDLRALRQEPRIARGSVLAGRYLIRSVLGQGGTGKVFRAFDRATGTTVALKVVRPELAGRRSAIERLGREVRHARTVQHPNVCRVFELAQSDGLTFLAMELATSGSLRATLRRRARRPMADRMKDAHAVTVGLAAIHAAGVVHRDFKPENLLRMADGRLVVSDFGLAAKGRKADARRGGTEGYIAPEVAAGRPATARSDVWALGVVLHEILFGRLPSPAPRKTTRVQAALAGLCQACMSPAPSDRPADAGAVHVRLEALAGEVLEDVLRRGPLAPEQVLQIASQVFESLARLHREGAVHGAVCPANIFVGGQTARLLGRTHGEDLPALDPHPRYVAPESARGGKGIDTRSDVFAAGRVLLECLAARHPRRRALAQDADVRTVDASHPVKALLRSMLSSDPAQRPGDAGVLAFQLASLAETARTHDAVRTRDPLPLLAERRISCVIAGRTVTRGRLPADIRSTVHAFGGEVARAGQNTFVATLQGKGTPSDLATTAARCALALRANRNDLPLAIVTGRVIVHPAPADDETAQHALALLRKVKEGDIRLDTTSAALLNPRFEVAGPSSLLVREIAVADRPRTVLGKQIPCVGRDREIATLAGIWDECRAEPVARTVLVTAPAGGGKSRVRHELLDRIQFAGEPFEVLIGRGDALRAGSPFAMLGPALRTAAGLVGGESPGVACSRLLAHVRRNVDAAIANRVAAFLGEIADVPFPDEDLPALRAARQDPRLMADQTMTAWLDLLQAQCKSRPVLLVLEDLHWGDAPSVQLVDAALRILHDRPLMVLALARPEVEEAFPNLWAERDLQRIALPRLTPRSAEKLVRHAVEDLAADQASWIVERADGNPFYLEELIRAVGTGTGGEALPQTVIGMVQARFDALGADAKRVLRAAAVFGQTFRAGGVCHLLGGDQGRTLDHWLDVLVQREILFPRHGAEAQEFVFRHALLQEAAYDMLMVQDRTLGHRLAGEYLEATGEREAILLVEHYERGGEKAKAAGWCRFAAEQALDANDLIAVVKRVERGVRLGASGELLGRLRLVEARARFWIGEYCAAELSATEAASHLTGVSRLSATREKISALGQQARFSDIETLSIDLMSRRPGKHARSAWLDCLIRATAYLLPGGQYAVADRLRSFISRCHASLDRDARARFESLNTTANWSDGRYVEAVHGYQDAIEFYERAGDVRSVIEMQGNLAIVLADLGALGEARDKLASVVSAARRLNLDFITAGGLTSLCLVHAYQGLFSEARRVGETALVLTRRQGDDRMGGLCETYLSMGSALEGDWASAEVCARNALQLLKGVPSQWPLASAALAWALLHQEPTLALCHARTGYETMERLAWRGEGEALVRLSYARALRATGNLELARKVLVTAQRRLLHRVSLISRPEFRSSFIEHIPSHAETMSPTAGEFPDMNRDRRTAGRRRLYRNTKLFSAATTTPTIDSPAMKPDETGIA